MITTIENRDFNVQVLTDTVQGTFAQKNAFMGSILVSQGAVMVDGQMPVADPRFIGNEITVPYFGTLGRFVPNPDGQSVTPRTMNLTHEKSQVGRHSLAFEVSHWAQHSGPADADPYEEASRQILEAAVRCMDEQIIAAAMTTPLVHNAYNAVTPNTISWDMIANARSKWGDENSDVVGMICHSRTVTDLRKLRDADGNPLLVEGRSMQNFDVPRFAGIPVIESDKAPLDGSTMGAVSSAGTNPPAMTITGTPRGDWDLRIECVVGGAHQTATIRFSVDGGVTWSEPLTTTAVGAPLSLIDTAKDSLVGVNGETGLSVAFAAGTFHATNTWSSLANLNVRTLLVKRRALAFWYNRAALGLETDKNVLAHTNIGAMHLYAVAHRYRRTPGGTKTGVIAISHNVGSVADAA